MKNGFPGSTRDMTYREVRKGAGIAGAVLLAMPVVEMLLGLG